MALLIWFTLWFTFQQDYTSLQRDRQANVRAVAGLFGLPEWRL